MFRMGWRRSAFKLTTIVCRTIGQKMRKYSIVNEDKCVSDLIQQCLMARIIEWWQWMHLRQYGNFSANNTIAVSSFFSHFISTYFSCKKSSKDRFIAKQFQDFFSLKKNHTYFLYTIYELVIDRCRHYITLWFYRINILQSIYNQNQQQKKSLIYKNKFMSKFCKLTAAYLVLLVCVNNVSIWRIWVFLFWYISWRHTIRLKNR